MTDEKHDETAGFVVTTSDMPTNIAPVEDAATAASTEENQPGNQEEKAATPPSSSTEDKSPADPGNDAAAAGKEGKPQRLQKRIDEVVREREDARREKEAIAKELETLKGKSGTDAKADKEPQEQDYKTYDEYLEALDNYDNAPGEPDPSGTAGTDDKGSGETVTLSDNQKSALAVIEESIKAADTPEDFEQVISDPTIPVTGDMLEALAECDDPTSVMYALCKDKPLAEKIAAGTPAQQARAIARLEIESGQAKPPKPAKTTGAPDPITPVNGSDQQPTTDMSKMSFAEYEKTMNKREKDKMANW